METDSLTKDIPGFELREKLAHSGDSALFRALEHDTGEDCLLNVIPQPPLTPAGEARLHLELESLHSLDNPALLKIRREIREPDRLVLVMDNFEAISLRQFMQGKSIGLDKSLAMALKLFFALDLIHKENIVHGALSPENVLVGKKDDSLLLLGYTSVTAGGKPSESKPSEAHEFNNLLYQAPEKSGRLKRSPDYRADLYSLGVILYELLTGRPPFQGKDFLELIHAHIALAPEPPEKIAGNTPPALSAAIQMLLAKSPDERYQSAAGVVLDLKDIQSSIRDQVPLLDFTPGLHDAPPNLLNVTQLTGREPEIETLRKALRQTRNGNSEIIMLCGPPGIGKSSLVQEIREEASGDGAYFIYGKYENTAGHRPQSALFQAFKELVRQVLSENEADISRRRALIEKRLGSNIGVFTQVIPEARFLLGDHPAPPTLGADETQNRLALVFSEVLRCFTDDGRSITIHLDDLQWVDAASLELINHLFLKKGHTHILILGAFRDIPGVLEHPLFQLRTKLEEAGRPAHVLTLAPLAGDDVVTFLKAILRKTNGNLPELAELLERKTGGNPFFIQQFLRSIYDQKLLRSTAGKGWEWDLKLIQALPISENMLEFTAENVSRLHPNLLELLKIAACEGSNFTPETLANVSGQSSISTFSHLRVAASENLINMEPNYYAFSHDRIQEAVYSLTTDSEKETFHYKIGRFKQKKNRKQRNEESLFEILSHLNRTPALIKAPKEIEELCRLNLRAGKKALTAAAFVSSLKYLNTALELLQQLQGPGLQKLSYHLFLNAGQAALACGQFEDMERYLEKATELAPSIVEEADICDVRITSLMVRQMAPLAIEEGLRVLRKFKISMPRKPSMVHVIFGFLLSKIRFLFKSQAPNNLGGIQSREIRAAVRLLTNLGIPAFWAEPNLVPLLIFKSVALTIKYGHSPEGVFSLAGYGMINCTIGDTKSGIEIGETAYDMALAMDNPEWLPRTRFVIDTFIRPWKTHIRDLFRPALENYRYALDAGDYEYASHAIIQYTHHLLMTGVDLKFVATEFEEYDDSLDSMGKEHNLLMLRIYRQTVYNLVNAGSNPTHLAGPLFNSAEKLEQRTDSEDRITNVSIHYYELILAFWFGNYEQALDSVERAEEIMDPRMDVTDWPLTLFYGSLIRLQLLGDSSRSVRRKFLRKIRRNQSLLERYVKHTPENYFHCYTLVQAELRHHQDKHGEGFGLHRQALESARKHKYTNIEAMTALSAARIQLELGDRLGAYWHIRLALAALKKWGATALEKKVNDFYKALLLEFDTELNPLSENLSDSFDLSTAMKSAQALAGEIELGEILKKIMGAALENAGAQKGFFLLTQEQSLRVVARADLKTGVDISDSPALHDLPDISQGIVNYVFKTGEKLLLDNAGAQGDFRDDPHIRKNQVRSLLCIPVSHKGRLTGILYLENNLINGAFSLNKLELLNILAAQAAISIENSFLLSVRENAARLEKEMEIASDIQTALLPQHPMLDGYDTAAHLTAADRIAGDYYDFINLPKRDWIIIGDVSGHGAPAGLMMMMVHTAIRVALSRNPDISPGELLSLVNETISQDVQKLDETRYMTITALVTDAQGNMEISGQHQDILVFRQARGELEIIETEGLWLGIPNTSDAPLANKRFKLDSGDLLLLYTDGITEAWRQGVARADRVPENDMFGEERLKEIFQASVLFTPTEICNSVLARVFAEHEILDDAAVIVLKKS